MADPVQNQLGQFDQNETNAIYGIYQRWRQAGADKSGAPLDVEANKKLLDYKDATEGYEDPNTRQFVPPWMQKVQGIDLKKPLEIKSIPDIPQQIKEQEDKALDTQIKKNEKAAEKVADGLTSGDPSFLSKIGSGALETIKELPSAAVGMSMGVAEALNPLSVPHFLETSVRAFGEDADPNKGLLGRIGERMAKAEQKTTIFPNRMDIGEISAGVRAGGRAIEDLMLFDPTTLMNLGKTYDYELANQKRFQESGNMPLYQTAGTVASAVPGVVALGKSGIQGVSKIAESVGKLKPGTVSDVLSLKKLRDTIGTMSKQAVKEAGLSEGKTPLRQTQEMYAEMLGDTANEIGDAIYKRTENIEALVNGPKEGRSLLPEVERIREHIDGTEKFIGEAVGEFRNFIANQQDVRVNLTGSFKKLSRTLNSLTTEAGAFTGAQRDKAIVARFKFLMAAPRKIRDLAKNEIMISGDFDQMLAQMTPRDQISFVNDLVKDIPYEAVRNTKEVPISDALLISDALDTTIESLKGTSGASSQKVLGTLIDIRRNIKGLIHEKFPAYAKADELYKNFKETSNSIRGKIDSMGGESFLSHIYGENKTEAERLLKNLIQQGKEASGAVREMGKNAKFGIRAVNKEAAALVDDLRTRAAEIDFPEAEEFFNDVADKIAARSLAKYKSSGQADFPADKVRSMQDRFIERAKNIAEAKGKLAGGFAGTVTGGVSGTLLGFLLAKQGGTMAQLATAVGVGGYGAANLADKFSKGAGFLARVGAGALAERRAKNLFTPQKLLENIKRLKTTSPELKSILSDATFIEKEFGAEEALRFLNVVPVSPEMKSAVENMALYSSSQGAARAVEEKNLGPFGQFLDFTKGSTVTPEKKEKK